jgi:isoquinoline 1-oxidoreductase subunit alpha
VLRPNLREFRISFTIDGEPVDMTAWSDMAALEALRVATNRTQFRSKCEMGLCGTCEVHVDGVVTRVCSLPSERLNGTEVVTR